MQPHRHRRPSDRFEIIAKCANSIRFGERPILNRSTDTEQDNRNTSFFQGRAIAARHRINALRTKALHFPARRSPPPLSPFTLSHAFTHTYILSYTRSLSLSLSLFRSRLVRFLSLPLYPFSLVWSIVDGRCSGTFRGCPGVVNGGCRSRGRR